MTYHRDMNRAFTEYAFIAHVKIGKKSMLTGGDSALVSTKDDFYNNYRKVTVEILELYKGTRDITILEWGVGSSCDMGLLENAEWVLFGNYTDKQFVGVNFCNTWLRLKNPDGERYGSYEGSIEAMNELRKLAQIPEKKVADGRRLTYYENGLLLADEGYKDGLLHGYSTVYYVNGNRMKEGEFRRGQPVGPQKEYARHGQLLSQLEYYNNHITRSTWWFDTAYQERRMRALFSEEFKNTDSLPPPLIQKSTEGWLDTLSGNRHSIVYNWDGKIKTMHFGFNNEQSKLSCEYYMTGALKADIRYIPAGDISIEKRWNETGALISEKRWEKGKLVYQSQ